MYKTKLQELCQKKSWPLPEYQSTRHGPPHDPRFATTVTVNSIPFNSSTPSRTVKLSQNDAAMLAFNHFSQPNPICSPFLPNFSSFPQPCLSTSSGSPAQSPDIDNIQPVAIKFNGSQPNSEAACQTSQINSPVSAVSDVTLAKPQDQKSMLLVYKVQLQNYAQKRSLNFPEYSSVWEGPLHAMRFKSKVTIDGKSYESPKFYNTLKEAEHAAAEVALTSLSPSGVLEDDIGIYKNLLHELVRREGFCPPVYSTNLSGEAHKLIFTSQVEVEGELFTGQESKSKKQSERSAAKVAYTTLRARKVKKEKQLSSSGNTNGCSEVTSTKKSKALRSFSDSNKSDFETSNVSLTSPRKKVTVYSRNTNVEIGEGGVLLPITDDKYVAYLYPH